MANRNPARLLAPLALLIAVIGVVVVIQASRSSTDDASSATRPTTTTQHQSAPVRPRVRVYVVKPGDTLSAIADKTGVSLETIQRLNPDVAPQALQTGQRLKLTS
jgi:LysM repeat protein